METPEIKTDIDLAALPTFTFITDRPMLPLEIKASPDEFSSEYTDTRVFSYKEGDARANDGKKRVRLTASSNATDLVGDVMSKNALQQMKDAAPGTTIFLNHDATVPDSVFGSVEVAELNTRNFTVVEDGKSIILKLLCLEYDVVVEEANDKAVKTWNIINNGQTKLGASVTIAITDKSNLSGGRRQIDSVYYLETSIVGIPCNQTAWVNQVKSKSWIHQAKNLLRERGKTLSKQISIEALGNAEPLDIDKIVKEPIEMADEKKVEKVVKSNTGVKDSADSNTKMKIATAKTTAEALLAFKDLFTDCVEEHFENPWLYTYLLEDAIMELIYCNSGMPTEEKIAAAKEMFDAFSLKMVEVLNLYWSDDAEKSVEIRKAFAEAASDHLRATFKAGNRNNKDDQKTLNSMHDMCVELGAACDTEEKSVKEEQKAITTKVDVNVMDLPEVTVAIAEANKALETLTTEKTVADAKISDLEKEITSLKLSESQWKAAASTATAMLEAYMDKPAVRPAGSVS